MTEHRNHATATSALDPPIAPERRSRRGRTARAAAGFGAALLLVTSAGCGVAVQDDAQSLPSGALPQLASTPTASPSALETAVYFVSGRQLKAVDEGLSDRSPQAMMKALAAGPPVERQAELRTLLITEPQTGRPLLSIASQPDGGQLTLERADAFAQMPSNDQVLLMGQAVLSLAEVGISSVRVTDSSGAPSSRVLPDGRSVDGPAVASEYAELIMK